MAEHDRQFMALAVDARRRVEATGTCHCHPLAKEVGERKMMPVHVLRAMIADRHVPRLKEAAELVVALGGNFTYDTPLAEVVGSPTRAGGFASLRIPGGPTLARRSLRRRWTRC